MHFFVICDTIICDGQDVMTTTATRRANVTAELESVFARDAECPLTDDDADYWGSHEQLHAAIRVLREKVHSEMVRYRGR